MKVCKFDKIEDEDKINRIIKYIINENPYVIAIPPLLPLEEKAREISIGWFREDNETVRSAIKSIEYYCYARVDRLTANVELQRNIKEIISTRIKNMYAWTENKADLLIDKTIRAEIYRLSADLLTHCLQAQGFRSKCLIREHSSKSIKKKISIFRLSANLFNNIRNRTGISTFS